MEDTIFSKIVRGEIPCHKVYENETTLAFLDIYPAHEGHVLIIPKVHPAEFVWDLDENTYTALMETTRKVALHLRSVLPYRYVKQAIVGTDVPYAHVHLVPFNEPSDTHNPGRDTVEPDHTALAALAQRLYFTD